jgi:5'-deoxynucleotidase YfbR-like HD superfamily hydrolase
MSSEHEPGNLVDDPRAAGEVLRYHTWRTIRQQNVAEHTWQLMRILLTVWPNAPRNVIIHALIHDMGEMAGDIQFPFKKLFPDLKTGSDMAENYVRRRQQMVVGAPVVSHPLSPYENLVFKTCDNLEMWEFGMVEMKMGNLYGKIVVKRMHEAVADCLARLEAISHVKQFQDNADVVPAITRYFHKRVEMNDGIK